VIPPPFGFLEVERELVRAHAPLLRQARLGEAPKESDAVDMAFAPRKFVFLMMHQLMFEPV
jgi:hypothetical protein